MNPEDFNFFGDGARFDHVGIAVRDIQKVAGDIKKTNDPAQGVDVAFIDIHGLHVELIEPAGEKSPVDKVLNNGQALYHLCFEVEKLERSIECARKYGFHKIGKANPAPALGGCRIIWLFSRQYGLIELVEKKKEL